MTSRRQRPSQVRPRPPSTGRPAPKRPAPRPLAPGRIAPHRRIERGPGLPIAVRILLIVAVVALGGAVAFAGMGLLARVVAGIGTAFSDVIAQVTTSPSPSPSEAFVPNAPTLSAPAESYTNQPTVDLTGTVPVAIVGQDGVTIRVYRSVDEGAPEQIAEVPVGETPGFTIPEVELAKGRNDFKATVVGPGGESESSPIVTYILDTSKPKITITKPAKDAVVNGKTVTILGKTQARSALVARNEANNASITGTAGDDGTFKLVLAIDRGSNGIRITATDPAGNLGSTVINVRRGSGKLTASITASRYQFQRNRLPEDITLTVVVTDPDGRGLEGATVTFTLTPPGVAPITKTLETDGEGVARWRTTIPKGASIGQGVAAALAQTDAYGQATAQTVISIVK